MKHGVNWVEIPVLDIQRAAAFYSAVYDVPLNVIDQSVRKLVLLPNEEGIGASLNQSSGFQPGDTGPLVYLNAGQDLSPMLGRVESAGGRIITPKTDLGGRGYYAILQDTEGNHVGLMSAN
jgi:predicted enzyme related to lactoylglutathione lyase